MLSNFMLICTVCFVGNIEFICGSTANEDTDIPKFVINDKVYPKIFVRRREEQKTLLKHFQQNDSYEHQFKLLFIGLQKIMLVLGETRQKLIAEQYFPANGFPKTQQLVEPVIQTIENTFLFAELYLHMPDLADVILKRIDKWKLMVDWALDFCEHFYYMIDEESKKMLHIFEQAINIDKRTKDFINPYVKDNVNKSSKSVEKPLPKTKPKRGPKLTGKIEL